MGKTYRRNSRKSTPRRNRKKKHYLGTKKRVYEAVVELKRTRTNAMRSITGEPP